MRQHTPGPWEIVQDSPQNRTVRYIIGARQPNGLAVYVCTIKQGNGLIVDGNLEANARLIVVAPRLLELCERLVAAFEPDEWSNYEPEEQQLLREATDVIETAKGIKREPTA